jgi:serine O-acetyltransferase
MPQSEAPYVPHGIGERPAPFHATQASQADGHSSRRADRPRLLRLIAEDYETHERKWSKPGFHTMVMYRFGAWRCTLPPIPRKLLRFPYWLMHTWCRNFYGIELHETATIGRRLRIAHQSGIVIHEYAVIGDDCIIRQGVTIGSAGRWWRSHAARCHRSCGTRYA